MDLDLYFDKDRHYKNSDAHDFFKNHNFVEKNLVLWFLGGSVLIALLFMSVHFLFQFSEFIAFLGFLVFISAFLIQIATLTQTLGENEKNIIEKLNPTQIISLLQANEIPNKTKYNILCMTKKRKLEYTMTICDDFEVVREIRKIHEKL